METKKKEDIVKEEIYRRNIQNIALGKYEESLGREEVSRKLRSDTLNVVGKKRNAGSVMNKEISRRHKSKGQGPRNGEDDGQSRETQRQLNKSGLW